MTIRTLILSGGGGRGAFHAGVYKYLCEANKAGLDAEHSGAWIPDVIVGTSIGAVNGAAITQGISADELEAFWLSLREQDIQGLPPGMGPLARWFANTLLRGWIGVPLAQMRAGQTMSPAAEDSWPPLPILPQWMGRYLIGRWSNMLDTWPLHQTLTNRLKLDPEKIAQSDRTLFISATNVRTGEGVSFCNRSVQKVTGENRTDVIPGITIKRIIASCSIPLVYPWTRDDDGEFYWDGAIVANTPLGAAFDAVQQRDLAEPMEIVIVLLNPWWETDENPPPRDQDLPADFGEAATWTLDWAMLASFRVSLKMLRSFNRLIDHQVSMGTPPQYRRAQEVMIAPKHFLPVTRIIDYDEPASRKLIDEGYKAAEQAFKAKFGTTE